MRPFDLELYFRNALSNNVTNINIQTIYNTKIKKEIYLQYNHIIISIYKQYITLKIKKEI